LLDDYGWACEPGRWKRIVREGFLPGEGDLHFDIKVVPFFVMDDHLPDAVRTNINKT
jgi:hypothetical protein